MGPFTYHGLSQIHSTSKNLIAALISDPCTHISYWSQVEVSSHLDDGDATEGRARVFFRRMFSGGQATNQMSVPPTH